MEVSSAVLGDLLTYFVFALYPPFHLRINPSSFWQRCGLHIEECKLRIPLLQGALQRLDLPKTTKADIMSFFTYCYCSQMKLLQVLRTFKRIRGNTQKEQTGQEPDEDHLKLKSKVVKSLIVYIFAELFTK